MPKDLCSRLATWLLLAVLCACQDKPSTRPPTLDTTLEPAQIHAPDRRFSKAASHCLNNSALAAESLLAQVQQLLGHPSQTHLSQAQHAWRITQQALETCAIFLHLSQVSAEYRELSTHYYNLAAWPIQPGYLDTYGEHLYSGLVFDISTPLIEDNLRELHGLTHDNDAAIGLYALEFLLFGEDNQRGPLVFLPITALDTQHRDDGYQTLEELPRNRRRALLALQSELLVADMARLQTAWGRPGGPSTHLETQPLDQQIVQLRRAALALNIAQLQSLAQWQSQSLNSTSLWQQQQFADRLRIQIQGFVQVAERMDDANLQTAGIQVVRELDGIIALSPMEGSSAVDWRETYQALRRVSAALLAERGAGDETPAEDATIPIETDGATQ